jgi:hypothetical protein
MFVTKRKNENEKLFIDLVNKKFGEKEFLTQEEIDEVFYLAHMLLK